jgi:Ca-activated chloride channel family protein
MPSHSLPVSIFLLALGLSLAPANSALAQERTDAEPSERQLVLVLDASGSMWGQIDGEPKIRIARGVVKSLLSNWNPTIDLGLTAYGHRRERDCDDIETLIAPGRSGAGRSSAILAAIDELNPRGKSPLAAALEHAAQSISYRERAATLLLVSDGRETCGADPCETAKQLARAGVDFTAHVVGFGVSDIDAEQLRDRVEQRDSRRRRLFLSVVGDDQ